MKYFLYCIITIFFLKLFSLRKDKIIVTLHNIPKEFNDWFIFFIKSIHNSIGFMNPLDLDKKNNSKVLLTFDDGFKSNKYVADNVLKKYEIKAIFFVTNNFIDLNQNDANMFAKRIFFPSREVSQYDGDLSSMTWSDLNELIEDGHVVGAHTFNHPKLSCLKNEFLKTEEITESGKKLEKKLNCSVDHFAYPFGNLNSVDFDSVNIASKHYKYSFSNIRGCVKDSPSNYFIYRQNIVPGMSLLKLSIILTGIINLRYINLRKEVVRRFCK